MSVEGACAVLVQSQSTLPWLQAGGSDHYTGAME